MHIFDNIVEDTERKEFVLNMKYVLMMRKIKGV